MNEGCIHIVVEECGRTFQIQLITSIAISLFVDGEKTIFCHHHFKRLSCLLEYNHHIALESAPVLRYNSVDCIDG